MINTLILIHYSLAAGVALSSASIFGVFTHSLALVPWISIVVIAGIFIIRRTTLTWACIIRVSLRFLVDAADWSRKHKYIKLVMGYDTLLHHVYVRTLTFRLALIHMFVVNCVFCPLYIIPSFKLHANHSDFFSGRPLLQNCSHHRCAICGNHLSLCLLL